jgi:hypothetical protein
MSTYKDLFETHVKRRKGNKVEYVNQRTKQVDASVEKFNGKIWVTAGGDSVSAQSDTEANDYVTQALKPRT